MELSVLELYREIGKEFREHGAERVALLSSRTCCQGVYEIELEVAADGLIDDNELHQISKDHWPYVQMKILNLRMMKTKKIRKNLMLY